MYVIEVRKLYEVLAVYDVAMWLVYKEIFTDHILHPLNGSIAYTKYTVILTLHTHAAMHTRIYVHNTNVNSYIATLAS